VAGGDRRRLLLDELHPRRLPRGRWTDGLLIEDENFQALNLLQQRYREQVKCIYIDPPYNTGSDGFLYKDRYQHSSWLSMMEDRLRAGREALTEDGVMFASIDDRERPDRRRRRGLREW